MCDPYFEDEEAIEDDKQKYFQWRENLPYDEDDGISRFAEEDAEKRKAFGVTDEDISNRVYQNELRASGEIPF